MGSTKVGSVKTIKVRIAELEQSLVELEQSRQEMRDELSQAQVSELLTDIERDIKKHKSVLLKAQKQARRENKDRLAELQVRLAPLQDSHAKKHQVWLDTKEALKDAEQAVRDTDSARIRARGAMQQARLRVSAIQEKIGQAERLLA